MYFHLHSERTPDVERLGVCKRCSHSHESANCILTPHTCSTFLNQQMHKFNYDFYRQSNDLIITAHFSRISDRLIAANVSRFRAIYLSDSLAAERFAQFSSIQVRAGNVNEIGLSCRTAVDFLIGQLIILLASSFLLGLINLRCEITVVPGRYRLFPKAFRILANAPGAIMSDKLRAIAIVAYLSRILSHAYYCNLLLHASTFMFILNAKCYMAYNYLCPALFLAL